MKDTVPPSAFDYRLAARPTKSFIDVLAEIDDWYAKELTTIDSWNMPTELLNAESRREIRKIAFIYGLKEALLLSLVTPFIYGVFAGQLNPVPEAQLIGKILSVFVLGWPYLILIMLPTLFALKVRGTITELLCKNAHVCRGLGLVGGTWGLAFLTIFLQRYLSWTLEGKFDLYFPYVNYDLLYLFPASWLWLLIGGFLSAIIPAIVAIYFPIRAKSKWNDFQELMRGLNA